MNFFFVFGKTIFHKLPEKCGLNAFRKYIKGFAALYPCAIRHSELWGSGKESLGLAMNNNNKKQLESLWSAACKNELSMQSDAIDVKVNL